MTKPIFRSLSYTGRAQAEYRPTNRMPVTLIMTVEAAEAIREVFGRIQRTNEEVANGLYDIDHDIYNRLTDVMDHIAGEPTRDGIRR